MSINSVLENLNIDEKVFIYCNTSKKPNLYKVKLVSKKGDKIFVIFVSGKKKIGIKLKDNEITYPSFNKKSKCDIIKQIITDTNNYYTRQI